MTFSFDDPDWRRFPRKTHDELKLASNELWSNSIIKNGALVCPKGDTRPEFIISKGGLDYLHTAKQDDKISEGLVVLVQRGASQRVVIEVVPVAEVVAALKGTTPREGPYGSYYWLRLEDLQPDDIPF